MLELLFKLYNTLLSPLQLSALLSQSGFNLVHFLDLLIELLLPLALLELPVLGNLLNLVYLLLLEVC